MSSNLCIFDLAMRIEQVSYTEVKVLIQACSFTTSKSWHYQTGLRSHPFENQQCSLGRIEQVVHVWRTIVCHLVKYGMKVFVSLWTWWRCSMVGPIVCHTSNSGGEENGGVNKLSFHCTKYKICIGKRLSTPTNRKCSNVHSLSLFPLSSTC